MTRTAAREIAMHLSFQQVFSRLTPEEVLSRELTPEAFEDRSADEPLYAAFPDQDQQAYISQLVCGVDQHREELDGYIEKYAKDWRVSRIDRVAASIMRLAIYEILYMPQVPRKVAINEAVEIAKKYLDLEVVGFINGILGSFVRAECPQDAAEPEGE